jgi:hypothetical protein
MKKTLIIAIGMALLESNPAHAINANYRQQLERSGCTQVSETQGCDITKTKEENVKAGFVTDTPTNKARSATQTPYAGLWVAKATSGATLATIRIDVKDRVWVNGKRVKAKRSDGALLFHDGKLTFTIQGDRRIKDEDYWINSDTGTKGFIIPE